jgi:molecular chaperone DnaK
MFAPCFIALAVFGPRVGDLKKKETAEVKNLAEQLIYTTEKALKDAEGKISEDIKKGVEEKITELKNVKDKDDISAIKVATENLSKEIQKIGEYMSNSAKASSDEQKNPQTPPSDTNASAESSGEPKEENK